MKKSTKGTALVVTGGPKLAPPSPRNGYRLPLGAHPKNTGGKKGRSGRKPDAFKRALEEVRDAKGLRVLEAILDGSLEYGALPADLDPQTLAKLVPTPDARLRAMELLLRYTLPTEKVVRLEGIQGAQTAFEVIKSRIRAKLAPDVADELIEDIHHALKGI